MTTCNVPPEGWTCSRAAGHPGPCAARPSVQSVIEEWFEELGIDIGVRDSEHLTAKLTECFAPLVPDADELMRMRRLMKALGHDDAFDQPAEYMRGILFTLLGQAAGKLEQANQPAPTVPATREAIEEAAQVFEAAAAYNRSKGRTIFAHSQQSRADRIRKELDGTPAHQPAQEHAEPRHLKWAEPKPPTKGSHPYDHVTAQTPFGEILITWKSWKDYPSYCVDTHPIPGYFHAADTLEDAKKKAEQDYFDAIAAQQEPVAASQQLEGDQS